MKFKKIVSICKKNKRFTLYNCNDFQLLSDGSAAYELIGHPEYDKESMQAVAEITNDSIIIEQKFETPFDIRDNTAADRPCELINMNICYRGNVWQPVVSENNIAFINNRYLTPFSDEEYTIWKRDYIYVVKIGMIAKAFICPAMEQNDDSFVKELCLLQRLTVNAREKMIADIDVSDQQQTIWNQK